MPKQSPSCILEKSKFPGQNFPGSLWAEEQCREWKNNTSTPVETLLCLPTSHGNAKNIQMGWEDVSCKVLKVGKATELDKILFLLTFPSRVSCTSFPESCVWHLTGSEGHVLLFLHQKKMENNIIYTIGSNLIHFYTSTHRFLKIRQITWSVISCSVITGRTSAFPNVSS